VAESTNLNEVKSALFALVAAAFVTACTEQPEREVQAVVLSIAPQANPKWNPDEVVLTARSPDGAFGSKSILISRLNCKVGDTLQATARGVALTLNDHACER
jgi:hypothetical protein